MKRKQHIALLMAGTLLLSAVLPYTQASRSEAAAKPKLSVKKLSLDLGRSKKIQVKNVKKKQLKKITWTAKSKKIVTVKKSGKLAASIKGKKTGTTKVTAKIYLKSKKKPVSAVVTVTVKKAKKTGQDSCRHAKAHRCSASAIRSTCCIPAATEQQ